jgi:hypothetical protein
MPEHHAVVDSDHHFGKNSVGRCRAIKATVALPMEIELVAFIPENAFYMNIQMNKMVKKGIKLMRTALQDGGFWHFSFLFLRIGIAYPRSFFDKMSETVEDIFEIYTAT